MGIALRRASKPKLSPGARPLKKAIGSEAVIINDQLVKLAPGEFESDVADFLRLAREGSEKLCVKRSGLRKAASSCRTDIKEAAWEDWLTDKRRRLDTSISNASLSLAEIEYSEMTFAAALRLAELSPAGTIFAKMLTVGSCRCQRSSAAERKH